MRLVNTWSPWKQGFTVEPVPNGTAAIQMRQQQQTAMQKWKLPTWSKSSEAGLVSEVILLTVCGGGRNSFPRQELVFVNPVPEGSIYSLAVPNGTQVPSSMGIWLTYESESRSSGCLRWMLGAWMMWHEQCEGRSLSSYILNLLWGWIAELRNTFCVLAVSFACVSIQNNGTEMKMVRKQLFQISVWPSFGSMSLHWNPQGDITKSKPWNILLPLLSEYCSGICWRKQVPHNNSKESSSFKWVPAISKGNIFVTLILKLLARFVLPMPLQTKVEAWFVE